MNFAPAVTAPPFCPNSACDFHRGNKSLWRFKKIGFYTRQSPPYQVQRWRCDACRRNFGAQTFSATYWMKRPELIAPVFHRLVSCSGFRQIALEFKASPDTIQRLSDRLGRHALLFHEKMRPKGPIREPVALDSFESFEYSQFYPTSYHVAAGRNSHFFYGFTDSECRRRGSMTKKQKERRAVLEERLGRPDPRSIELEVARLLECVAPDPQPLELHTDEHKSYPRAVRRLRDHAIAHRTISSRAARTTRNPLFEINLLDLLMRHTGSNHKRETIAFSKRRASAAYRMALFLVWRNWMRSFSVRTRGPSPAMMLGLADRLLGVKEVFRKRLFPSLVLLPERWRVYYGKLLPTRAIPNGRSHALKYAI
jgi:transposase-like protein